MGYLRRKIAGFAEVRPIPTVFHLKGGGCETIVRTTGPMSKRPQRSAAHESSAKTKALADAASEQSDYSDEEEAGAFAALKARELAAASSRASARERVQLMSGKSSGGSGGVGGVGGGGSASHSDRESLRRGGGGGMQDDGTEDSDMDYQDELHDRGDDSDAGEDEDFAEFLDGSSDEEGADGGVGEHDNGDDDDDEVSSKSVISEAEKSTISTIKEKLGFTEHTTFIKDMTKGLCAFVICHQKKPLTLEAKVQMLSVVSFHQELLSDASRKLICEQTVRVIKTMDLSKIKEESHKIFYELANHRRTRLVAGMISNIDSVLAGILILQLSLAQIAAGRVTGESFSPEALAEQTTLLDHLKSLGPIEAVAQICTMVIANAMHVRRRKIKNHLLSTRPPQLFDKRPIVYGMATRAEQVGQFVVRVQVAVEGDMHAQGGHPDIVKVYGDKYKASGIVSVLPAQFYDHFHGVPVTSFPFKKTTYVDPSRV